MDNKKVLGGIAKAATGAAKPAAARPAAGAARPAAAAAKPTAGAVNKVGAVVKQAAGMSDDEGTIKKMVELIKGSASGKVDENTRKDMFSKICTFVPNKVDNKMVVKAFELMRKAQKFVPVDCSTHLKTNQLKFKGHESVIKQNKGYIEDQNKWTDLAYGQSTMQFSGCEVFATYNAMFNITGKHDVALPEMISEYEKDGMVLSGKFGTSPRAIEDFLKKHGFKTQFATEESQFDSIGKTAQSLILTMYNDGSDLSQEVHTVNISKENNKFTGHNVYCNGSVVGPCASVTELIKNINKGKAKGISLIGINK